MSITVDQMHQAMDELRRLRDKRGAAKAAFTKADRAYKEQKGLVRELMEDLGISHHRTARGGYQAPEPTWYATIQDFGAYQKWAEQENPSLLRPDTRVSSDLNKLVRACIDDGRPLPPGIGAYPKADVKVTK